MSQRFGVAEPPREPRFVEGLFCPPRLSPTLPPELLPPGSLRIEGAEHEQTDSVIASNAQPHVSLRLIHSIQHRTASRR
jgi:hypothetical protein